MDEISVVQVETNMIDIDEVVKLARERYARGQNMRGLPKPKGKPADGWYSQQMRTLADGTLGVYLMYRWRLPDSDKGDNCSLGRLN